MNRRKFLIVFLAAMLMTGLMLPAQAETTLVLGDGARISYLEGFESRLIKDPALLSGITGQTDIRLETDDGRTTDNQGKIRVHIQNIAITDDALALFYLVEFPVFLPLDYGHAPESYSQAVPFVMPFVNGSPLPFLGVQREGHPAGEKSLYCLSVMTLKSPIADDAVLTFNNSDTQAVVNKARVKDPTRAVTPKKTVKFNYEISPGQTIDYQFTVERVSFGPFGNRLLLINRDDGRGIGGFPFVLADSRNQPITTVNGTYHGNSLASPVNVMDVHNEIFFFGDEEMTALRLIPVQSWEVNRDRPDPVAVPLDGAFPVTLTLPNDGELMIHSVQMNEEGLTIHHSGQAQITFSLGDAEGKPIKKLNDQAVTFDGYDLKKQQLITTQIWIAEYKGQPVSRVSLEDMEQAKTLLVEGAWWYESKMMSDLTVEVPIK